jgi:hypothetical protein
VWILKIVRLLCLLEDGGDDKSRISFFDGKVVKILLGL